VTFINQTKALVFSEDYQMIVAQDSSVQTCALVSISSLVTMVVYS